MLELTRVVNGSGKYMIRNNIEVDVKVKCIENGTTQARIATQLNWSNHLKIMSACKTMEYTSKGIKTAH